MNRTDGPDDGGRFPPPPPPLTSQLGAPPTGPPVMPYGTVGTKSTNGFAIAALVCPLVACGVGSILGIVFGHVARRQIKRTGEGGAVLRRAIRPLHARSTLGTTGVDARGATDVKF